MMIVQKLQFMSHEESDTENEYINKELTQDSSHFLFMLLLVSKTT